MRNIKQIMALSAALLLIFAVSSALAQSNSSAQIQKRQGVVDVNRDVICDITGQKIGSGAGTGQGQQAKRYRRSPVQIYTALKTNTPASAVTHQPAAGERGRGGGQGFKTLAELATENGLSSEAAIQNLAAKGIQAKADDKMRDIANRSGRKPYEVIEILKGNERK